MPRCARNGASTAANWRSEKIGLLPKKPQASVSSLSARLGHRVVNSRGTHDRISSVWCFRLGTATLAAAQTAEEQALCQDDAFRLCSQTIPDRERTFQCMVANKDSLSSGCRAVMARLLAPDASSKSATRRLRKDRDHGPASLRPPKNSELGPAPAEGERRAAAAT